MSVKIFDNQTPRGRYSPGLHFDFSGAVEAAMALERIKSMPLLAQKRTLSTLRRKIGTEANRDIRREYNIKQGRVAKDLGVSLGVQHLRIIGHFRGIGLRNFGSRQTKKGVSYSAVRGRRGSIEHAFHAGLNRGKQPRGNEHVVSRSGEKRIMRSGSYVGKLRETLLSEYGPTVAQMLRKGNRPQRLADFARGVLRGEIDRQLTALARKEAA